METNILDNFDLPIDKSGNFRAKCCHCNSVVNGSLKVTSNYVTHLNTDASSAPVERFFFHCWEDIQARKVFSWGKHFLKCE